MDAPLLVFVAVADVVVAETDPVEVPALTVANPVVEATDAPRVASN
jgi:hypothetical protein